MKHALILQAGIEMGVKDMKKLVVPKEYLKKD